MRRMLATLVFGVGTVGAIGCAGNATLVHKTPDGSSAVIAVKATGDYNAEAQKMASKVLGGEVEVVGTTQPSLQQGGFDPSKPNAGTTDPNVMHVTYRKKVKADLTGFPPAPGGGLPGPGMPGGTGGAGSAGGFQPGMGGVGMPNMGGDSTFGTNSVGAPPAAFPASR